MKNYYCLLLLFSKTSNFFSSKTSLCCCWAFSRSDVGRRSLSLSSSLMMSTSSSSETTKSNVISPLVSSIKPSKTVEIFSLVKEMEASGQKVTSLCVGEPDFQPPQVVLDATIQAIQEGKTKYTAVTGTVELRKAICDDLYKRKGNSLKYNYMTDIIVGNGAKQSVYQSILATCTTGDAVIIPAPYWPSYPEMVTLVGAKPIILQTSSKDGYLINPTDLRLLLEKHPETKLLILCNPSNPTGGVHNKERLHEIAIVLQDYPNVLVLADEIYERLVYSDSDDNDNDDNDSSIDDNDENILAAYYEKMNNLCPSFASISPEMFNRTITINGFSKAYAMTGYRLGYAAAPTHIAKAITTIQSQLTSCASSISQEAGVVALTQVSEKEMFTNIQTMKNKRNYVIKRLKQMPNVNGLNVIPNGAFYIMPNFSYYYDGDDTKLCIDLLKEQKLALVPGSSFGMPGTIRISYATSFDELDVAMTKLHNFLISKDSK